MLVNIFINQTLSSSPARSSWLDHPRSPASILETRFISCRYCVVFWSSYGLTKGESFNHLVMGALIENPPSSRIFSDCLAFGSFSEAKWRTQAGRRLCANERVWALYSLLSEIGCSFCGAFCKIWQVFLVFCRIRERLPHFFRIQNHRIFILLGIGSPFRVLIIRPKLDLCLVGKVWIPRP